MWADPDALMVESQRLLLRAGEVDDELARAPSWEILADTAVTGLLVAADATRPGAALAAGRLVAGVETVVLQVILRSRALSLELVALAQAYAGAARVLGAVEDLVGAALRRLDQFAHDHPDRIEWVAGVGHRYALAPIRRGADAAGVLVEGPALFLGMTDLGTRPVPSPVSLADLVASDVEVEQHDGRVRITEITHPDGSHAWVVAISGTQSLDPRPGPNPFDVTTDGRAIDSSATIAAIGVHLAVLEAQRATGRDTSTEPILLTGHSLGGMIAAALAADPSFRDGRRVTGVVTAGSPTGRFAIPREIGVVAIEHRGDLVPRLDGIPGREGGRWTTAVVDPDARATDGRATRSHAGDLYVGSAARLDRASDPDRATREEVIAPFVGSGNQAVAHDVLLTREWQNPRS